MENDGAKKRIQKEFPKQKNEKDVAFAEYMEKLRNWQYNCQMQQWFWMHNMMMQNMTMHQQYLKQMTNGNAAHITNSSNLTQPTDQTQARVQRFMIPSLFRRFAAEVFDFLILLSIKLLFLWLLMAFLGINAFQISFHLMLLDEVDMDQLEEIYTEELQTMLIVAFLYRTMCCLYEFFFIWKYGATPGKYFLGLKVIALFNQPQLGNRSGVTTLAGGHLTASNSWTRTFVKNLSIAFMIPTFITGFFYAHKRTSYDIMSNTIVVLKPQGQIPHF
uniref:Protein FAM8A1-like n=1 Tax=Ciona intestinalis TaxID=7719 RepID=F6U8R6_CIOIN|nr:protein FAM8A1-like [Ciona intestinalis]|eukprot:XP_002126302.1 protein FAM8A1-like [Ciona intestinalis]